MVNPKNKCLLHHFGEMLPWKSGLRIFVRAEVQLTEAVTSAAHWGCHKCSPLKLSLKLTMEWLYHSAWKLVTWVTEDCGKAAERLQKIWAWKFSGLLEVRSKLPLTSQGRPWESLDVQQRMWHFCTFTLLHFALPFLHSCTFALPLWTNTVSKWDAQLNQVG